MSNKIIAENRHAILLEEEIEDDEVEVGRELEEESDGGEEEV